MARQDVRPARSAGRTDTYFAPSGLNVRLVARPRAKPWAISSGPFRARWWHHAIELRLRDLASKHPCAANRFW